MNERTNEQTNEQTNEPTNQRTNKQANKRTNERMNERTNEPTNQRTNQQTNEQTILRCRRVCVEYYLGFLPPPSGRRRFLIFCPGKYADLCMTLNSNELQKLVSSPESLARGARTLSSAEATDEAPRKDNKTDVEVAAADLHYLCPTLYGEAVSFLSNNQCRL